MRGGYRRENSCTTSQYCCTRKNAPNKPFRIDTIAILIFQSTRPIAIRIFQSRSFLRPDN
jgi:hypothetical protein